MKLSPSEWLFYSLELLSIISIVLVLFGRLIISRLKWGGSKLKWSYLRDASNSASPSWAWLGHWTDRWKGWANAYWVGAVCLFSVLGFISVPMKHWIEPAPTMTAHYWYLPHVSEEMADNIYVVLLLDRNDPLYGTRPRYTFCARNQPIVFDEGELITDIVYKEHIDCKELVSYNLERDEHFHVKHYPEEAFNHGYGR